LNRKELAMPLKRFATPTYWTITAALFLIGLALVAFYAPVESSMGVVQKIFYVHLPVAICMFIAALTVFIASIGYLLKRSLWWDDLAAAAGSVTALLATVVLLTGMTWGRSAWGAWWSWTPRLTFSLVLWLLYIVYVLIRPSIDSPQRRALICAVYGLAAFLDVPLVYLSTKLMPDIHPGSITLEPAMQRTLLFWFAPVLMLTVGMIRARFVLNRASHPPRYVEETDMAEAPTGALEGGAS
jgi:heme exporter protein C